MVEMDTLNTRARLTLDDLETGIEADITLSIPLDAVAKLVQFDQLGIGDHIYIDPLGDELLISFTLHNERAFSGYVHPA
jgi:hypothetical protein